MILEGIAERSSLEYVVNTYIEDWATRYNKAAPNEAIFASIPLSPSSSSSERQPLRADDEEITAEEENDEGVPLDPRPMRTDASSTQPQGEDPRMQVEVEVSDEGWKEVMLVDAMNDSNTAVLMDFSPSQIPDTTPLNKVFHLFVMLGLSFTFVTRYGAIVGVITKRDLIKQEL